MTEVLEELTRYNIDIAVLTETKRKGTGTEIKQDYIHIYSEIPKDQRAK